MNRDNCYNNPELRDYGVEPMVVNIERVTQMNPFFRVALWTGEHFQLTLMSIDVGSDIGIECHPDVDQFLRIESGHALVKMGSDRCNMNYEEHADARYAIIIPAGTWHNVINMGKSPLKLYSIYAPVQHPYGTVHRTKADSEH